MLIVYNTIQLVVLLIGFPLWLAALARPKRRATFRQRLGCGSARQAQRLTEAGHLRPIWIHALSVGEVMSAEPIVNRLRKELPRTPLVFSASTRTGMQTAQRLFTGKLQHLFFFPYDLLFSVRHVVGRINPCLVVIVETDIWPNILHHLKRRGVPALWVNARISRATWRGFRLLGPFGRNTLDCFEIIAAQSHTDVDLLRSLDLRHAVIRLAGNVKFDQPGSDAPQRVGVELRRTLGIGEDRRVIIMGSTHAGEEEVGLSVFIDLKRKFKDLQMIIAPRDPARAEAVMSRSTAMGLAGAFLSSLHHPRDLAHYDLLVVNAIGLLRQLYYIVDVAFVGGSLVPEGGHNPLEPAACAKPVLYGPDMSDFSTVAMLLEQGGGGIRISGKVQLYDELYRLLSDNALRERMGRQALDVFQSNKGAVERTVAYILSSFAGV